ncbi:hypothetical protein [Thermocatellispora tengchongensis]|uniref:hypothetical protein n=1 Tax=Thermocatellispora tengchongensis TaxID=1073253 RepID=UPI0036420E9E
MDIGGHVAALGGGPGADRRLWRISDDLGALRAQVRTFAGRAGLSGDRLDDLVLAANEAAVGVLTQGGEDC